MRQTWVLMAIGSLALGGLTCSKAEQKEMSDTVKTFQGHKLNRRYQIPDIKSFVTLPADWKAQIKQRPDWAAIKKLENKNAAQDDWKTESELIFEAKPTLDEWTSHLTRLEIYLDAPLKPSLSLNAYAKQSGLVKDPQIKVLHLEREQLTLDERPVLSTRRELSLKGQAEKSMQMRQYILHAFVPVPQLDDKTVGLTFVLSATSLETLNGLKEKTLRSIMSSLAFKKR